MKVSAALVIALVCVAVDITSSTSVTSCLSSGSQTVTITDCTSGTCILEKGKTVKMTVEFTASEASKKLKNKVTASIFGFNIPFYGVSGKTACDNLYYSNGTTASCPLVKDTKYIYEDSFEVYDDYPSIKTTVTWKLVDSHKKNQVCFKVPVRIESA